MSTIPSGTRDPGPGTAEYEVPAAPVRHSRRSEAQLRHRPAELAGPYRELPDRRVHELFEERAARHPDAVAVVSADGQRTYGEINSRANRIGRALLAHGLRPEGVVAVLLDRNLDWPAAVLGILKAGGACLPIGPHLPVGQVRMMLNRADYSLLLGPDSVAAAYAEDHADTDLGVPVAAGRPAALHFTSGSSGESKGTVGEHAGFANHVLAKVDDLGLGAADVVAQTAPPCRAGSLWQLMSPLLAGGQTLLVGPETVRDVPRFVDTIEHGRVSVMQVSPSYLESMLTELARRPRELPHLRRVMVSGEPLRTDLVRRWFAALPSVPLVNSFGLPETSGDTHHEILYDVPAGHWVPLGRPIANVRVYVVDERLAPVPLGAPGELVFSGVCVGRGYVNDPERTRAAFTEDPYRPGERLYRGGDRGRRLPDGKLELLGTAR
ncbi:amino acid adenylation domain-containing protein [Streptomyces sp. NBC_00663]|uniref:amino acid adenylation domain-containing protein n=1 Tax=Streptomyces sp. NBC_00663 TaxID=2975801 RepID=UPI002E30B3D9|nr:amino acid adenylation domain-containing protein [Streptomyces sp. NBC_00663]